MATNTAGNDGTAYHTNQMHYIEAKITYADDGTNVTVGTLPEKAVITGGGVVVTTAFDGDTTNTCDIGFSGVAEDIASNLALGTIGVIAADETATLLTPYSTSSRDVIAGVVSTASATAGEGYVWVEYFIHRGD